MDFRRQVWRREWKMIVFGLKKGQDLENQAAHPHQEFPGVSPGHETNIWHRVDNVSASYLQCKTKTWGLRYQKQGHKKKVFRGASSPAYLLFYLLYFTPFRRRWDNLRQERIIYSLLLAETGENTYLMQHWLIWGELHATLRLPDSAGVSKRLNAS